MKYISLHLMDLIQNSLNAGATSVKLTINENIKSNLTVLELIDNGKGMSEQTVIKAVDPFFTTVEGKNVGLGIPLLKQSVERTGGIFLIESYEEKGTKVKCIFCSSHIDMLPLGDISSVLALVCAVNSDVDFIYIHQKNEKESRFESKVVQNQCSGIKINMTEMIEYIQCIIKNKLYQLDNN